eukprot:SAG31_NODE_3272_length_4477_cov_1.981270_1_plen_130_part_00
MYPPQAFIEPPNPFGADRTDKRWKRLAGLAEDAPSGCKRMLDAVFSAIDGDDDGEIDKQELLFSPIGDALRQHWAIIDADSSTSITRMEWAAFFKTREHQFAGTDGSGTNYAAHFADIAWLYDPSFSAI